MDIFIPQQMQAKLPLSYLLVVDIFYFILMNVFKFQNLNIITFFPLLKIRENNVSI